MKPTVREAIVVEGKHDEIRLKSVVDATVVATDGFGIFKQPEKMTLLRKLASAQGLIVLTDSDSAGFVIRDRIAGSLPADQVKHAYAPEIAGKERRKRAPSKEGLLGVEGIDGERLLQVLMRAGATIDNQPNEISQETYFTKMRMYDDGLLGKENSAGLRAALLAQLQLPRHLSSNRLQQVIPVLLSEEEYRAALRHIKGEDRE